MFSIIYVSTLRVRPLASNLRLHFGDKARVAYIIRLAGFQTWKSLGRFVRRGEKGIAILAPIVRRRSDDSADEPERAVVGFRAAYVFDGLSRDSEHECWS